MKPFSQNMYAGYDYMFALLPINVIYMIINFYIWVYILNYVKTDAEMCDLLLCKRNT